VTGDLDVEDELTGSEPIEILLVEDNPGDVRLVEEGLSTMRIANDVTVLRDGDEALDYLHREDGYEDASRPELILLDLNLPRVGGHELLARVKDDPELQEIPVVILTTSDDEDDLRKSYQLQAAGFITKPMDVKTFIATIHELGLYWVQVVKLPNLD
jgi:CheY-like chemotaxis protein